MPEQKIVPHLWFDKEAKEAAEFYTAVFPGSKVTHVAILRATPSGDAEVVSFELSGYRFMAISAGPLFKFNPSLSFILNFDPSTDAAARERLDAMWDRLSRGGTALMPLGAYPFSPRYGWVQDRYGLSWQLILRDPTGEPRPFITPCLLYVGQVRGKAEEAVEFYLSVFRRSRRGITVRYAEDGGGIMFADFMLEGQWFAAMDGPGEHEFAFNEAVSLLVRCESQEEIDYYWQRLSAVPEREECGWLKDKYGVSWQIVPAAMDEMMRKGTAEQVARLTQAFLKMKKLDIAQLRQAYEGLGDDAVAL